MTTGRRVLSARSLVAEAELPVHEAARLMEAATGMGRVSIARNDLLQPEHAERFDDLVARRRNGEPLQYIEGSSHFGPIEVSVDPRVLIPRPETEQLWDLVVAQLDARPPAVIVDLGTGSGNLALALKHSFTGAEVHAVDLSPSAYEVAQMNIVQTGLDVLLHLGDLFEPLPERIKGEVDLIISNPPYIATGEHGSLPREVRDHEPAMALFAGDDGLEVLRRIVAAAPDWLSPGGLLACEIGFDQGETARGLVSWGRSDIVRDLAGRDRFLLVTKGDE